MTVVNRLGSANQHAVSNQRALQNAVNGEVAHTSQTGKVAGQYYADSFVAPRAGSEVAAAGMNPAANPQLEQVLKMVEAITRLLAEKFAGTAQPSTEAPRAVDEFGGSQPAAPTPSRGFEPGYAGPGSLPVEPPASSFPGLPGEPGGSSGPSTGFEPGYPGGPSAGFEPGLLDTPEAPVAPPTHSDGGYSAVPETTTRPGEAAPLPLPSEPSGGGDEPGSSGEAGTGKTWDVFFDSKEGTRTKQRSPIVLDLNGNGRADITGANIKGDGKIDGGVNGFDLNPSARQWKTRSKKRRPGHGAPKLPKGSRMDVFDASGKLLRSEKVGEKFKGSMGLKDGERAEFRDPDGKLVGELKQVDKGNKSKKGSKFQYHWGNANQNEWTKPWGANGGDGILAWDLDKDGKITSGKELFGHVDVDGTNRFANGYEKLAAHFDKDGNGVVEGQELNGLKVWEDRNGDGITQDGELVDLADRGITRLDTNFNADDMSSSFKRD